MNDSHSDADARDKSAPYTYGAPPLTAGGCVDMQHPLCEKPSSGFNVALVLLLHIHPGFSFRKHSEV